MSNDGPVKIEGKQIIDMPFLYPDRILELAQKSALSSKMEIEPAVKATGKEVLESSMGSIDDEFALSEDGLEFLLEESQARATVSFKAESDVIEEHKLSLLDFLIARSGYPIQDIENYSEHYRLQFENIILEKDGVFEKFFLAVQNNIELLSAEKGNEKKSKTTITKEAREKALVDLGPGIFERLGKYYKENSKYYFEENDLSKLLSKHFLTQLYKKPELANQMLKAQENKTQGQHNGMVEEFKKLLPFIYNGTMEELKYIENDFDLFLISPSVLDIATNKERSASAKTNSRADLLSNLHDVLEIVHNYRKNHNFTLTDVLKASDKRPLDLQHNTMLEEEFSRLTIQEKSKMTPLMYIHQRLLDFRKILTENNIEFFDSNDFVVFNSLNPAEMVFVIEKFMMDFMNKIQTPKVNEQKKPLQAEIKKKELELKHEKTRVTTEYLKENHEGKDLLTLAKLLKAEVRSIQTNIKNACDNDDACKKISNDISALNTQLSDLQASVDMLNQQIKDFKDDFIKEYYPQIIPVANGLAQSYEILLKQELANNVFLKNGGTYSCLTFLPIKINACNEEGEHRFECLIAMSGAELDDGESINAHAVLKKFAENIDALEIPEQGSFTFRYVGPSSPSLDLLLKQVGKGLSGSEQSLSSLKQDVLPTFEKACAEKRLINELIALFSSHGEQVQVLGCDNIALPKYIDTMPERQKVLAPVVERPVIADNKAKKKQAIQKKSSNYFTIDAKLSNERDDITYLSAEHITCCSSCQAQKPAVMTVLFNALRQSEKLAEKQRVLLSAMPVKEEEKVSIVNADARHCGMESGVIEKDARKTLVSCM